MAGTSSTSVEGSQKSAPIILKFSSNKQKKFPKDVHASTHPNILPVSNSAASINQNTAGQPAPETSFDMTGASSTTVEGSRGNAPIILRFSSDKLKRLPENVRGNTHPDVLPVTNSAPAVDQIPAEQPAPEASFIARIAPKALLVSILPISKLLCWLDNDMIDGFTTQDLDSAKWSPAMQSDFIDALLEGCYTPPFSILVPPETQGLGASKVALQCLDGKQRILAIKAFVDGRVPCHDANNQPWYYRLADNADPKSKDFKRMLPAVQKVRFTQILWQNAEQVLHDQAAIYHARYSINHDPQFSISVLLHKFADNPWLGIAKDFSEDFQDLFQLSGVDHSRQQEFSLVCIIQIAKMKRGQIDTLQHLPCTEQDCGHFLTDCDTPSKSLRIAIARPFIMLKQLVTTKPACFRSYVSSMNDNRAKTLDVVWISPVELVAILVLLLVVHRKLDLGQTFEAVQGLLKACQTQYSDIRFNQDSWHLLVSHMLREYNLPGTMDGVAGAAEHLNGTSPVVPEKRTADAETVAHPKRLRLSLQNGEESNAADTTGDTSKLPAKQVNGQISIDLVSEANQTEMHGSTASTTPAHPSKTARAATQGTSDPIDSAGEDTTAGISIPAIPIATINLPRATPPASLRAASKVTPNTANEGSPKPATLTGISYSSPRFPSTQPGRGSRGSNSLAPQSLTARLLQQVEPQKQATTGSSITNGGTAHANTTKDASTVTTEETTSGEKLPSGRQALSIVTHGEERKSMHNHNNTGSAVNGETDFADDSTVSDGSVSPFSSDSEGEPETVSGTDRKSKSPPTMSTSWAQQRARTFKFTRQ